MQGDTTANYEALFSLYMAIAVVVGLAVLAWLAVTIVRFRERKGGGIDVLDEPRAGVVPHERGHPFWIWTMAGGIALILFALAFGTLSAVHFIEEPPEDPHALHVDVTGFRYGWTFTYPEGFESSGKLVVPVDTTVILRVTSLDVLHKFHLTEFRVGIDAVPGKHTQIWFKADETGVVISRCAELCGPQHALMLAEVHVVSQTSFDAWVAGKLGPAPSAAFPVALLAASGAVSPATAVVYAGVDALVTFSNGADRPLSFVSPAPLDFHSDPIAAGATATWTLPIDEGWTADAPTLPYRLVDDADATYAEGGLAVVAPQHVAVSLREWEVVASSHTVLAGVPVVFDVANDGTGTHDLTIGTWNKQRPGESRILWNTPLLRAGESARLVAIPSEAAAYDAWCNVPGHAQLGMITELEVTA